MKATPVMVLMMILHFTFISNGFGQELNIVDIHKSDQERYDFHIAKMKSNNTAASIILGSGIALVAVGTLINYTSIVIDELPNGETIIGLGLATTLVSIPLFIAGNNHKNKAQIQLKKGAIGITNVTYSGFSFTYSF